MGAVGAARGGVRVPAPAPARCGGGSARTADPSDRIPRVRWCDGSRGGRAPPARRTRTAPFRSPSVAPYRTAEAVVEERARVRRPGGQRVARPGDGPRPLADRLRVLLPRGQRHVLPQRRGRRRERPAPSDQAQPTGRVGCDLRRARTDGRRPAGARPAIGLAFAARWELAATDRRLRRRSPRSTRRCSRRSRSSTSWPSPRASSSAPLPASPRPACRSPTGS